MQEKPRHPGTAIEPVSPTPGSPSPAGQGTHSRRRFVSEQLFGEHTEVEIQHGTALYRLRLTSLGKLILTK